MKAPLLRWHNGLLDFTNSQAGTSLLWTDLQPTGQKITHFLPLLSAPFPKQEISPRLLCAYVTLCVSPAGVRALTLSKDSFLSFFCPYISFPLDFRGPHFCHGLAGTMCGSVGVGASAVSQRWTDLFVNHSELVWVPYDHKRVLEGCAALQASCFAMSPDGKCFQLHT